MPLGITWSGKLVDLPSNCELLKEETKMWAMKVVFIYEDTLMLAEGKPRKNNT
jgi:hypothetical protein